MRVNEIYYALQGEGGLTGVPMVFVRLQGCNLAEYCSYCDTKDAQSSVGGEDLAPLEVLTRILGEDAEGRWVCITGGEPLYQERELKQLVLLLHEYSCQVEIETNGTLPVPEWYEIVNSWVADVKCPSSGVTSFVFDWLNLRKQDQLKFVVGSEEDLRFVESIVRTVTLVPQVIVSPALFCDSAGRVMLGDSWLQAVSDFCLENRLRMSIQMHKIVYGNRRGK